MPRVPAPMLASPAGELPPLNGWTVEPKWDGIRVIADVSRKGAHLWSRNGIDKASQFPAVSAALAALADEKGPFMLDGELVAVDKAGKPLRFQALQGRHLKGATSSSTAFVAFDCLFVNGEKLTRAPWTERRRALESLVPKSTKRGVIRLGESHRCGSRGAARLFTAARREGWEGLLLKRVDAPYMEGKRTPLWRKVKLEHEQEFVIGGYTLPTDGADREHFGALLVGWYDDTGMLRQPAFLGLRDDKDARDVRLEAETSSGAILDTLRCAS